MAHLATLLMIPVEEASKAHTRESLAACVVRSSYCSHFIAVHPDIKPILNEGTPLNSEMWHPIAKPHYRFPSDLPPMIEVLKRVETMHEIAKDAWTLAEIRRLREACETAVQSNLLLVVVLSNTLSRPPMPRKA
jgi:hypothetical protein